MEIKCIDCNKTFRQGRTEVEAVRSASTSFLPGMNFVVGKSGSGKSTLLHMLAGLEVPTSGKVLWNDKSIYTKGSNISLLRKRYSGFVFQSYNLVPELTVIDNILLPFYLGAKDDYNDDEADEIVTYLDIKSKLANMPSSLSGGEQQRVAIARAVIHKPEVIFADEPTGNLDETNSRRVMDMFYNIVKNYSNTLIMVTHDYDLLRYADRKFTMKDGRIEEA